MGDEDRDPGLLPDGEDLVDGFPEPPVLAADVAGVAAAVSRGHPCELDDFLGGGIDPGVVLEPGAQTQGTGVHFLRKQFLHPLDLFDRRSAFEVVAHYFFAEGSMTDERGDVDARWVLFEGCEELVQRVP